MKEIQQLEWAPARSSSDAVRVEGLTKRYGEQVQALAGVSFAVRQGEIFGLLGPNGAGKTTAVRILATLTQPDDGQAEIAGYDVVRQPDKVRQYIGYVAQQSGVDKHATGHENLTLQAQLQRVPRQIISQRVDALLARVGLAEAADRIVGTYSGGMQRRLDIAMGLVHEPAVLFLDEPTTGLDPETRAALWDDLIRLRKEQGLAVLLTTHYLEEADQLCDGLVIIDHGQRIALGTPAELKAQIQGDTVTLEVDGQTARAADELRQIENVRKVIPNGSSISVQVDEGASALPDLIRGLERAGVQVKSVALSQPSLDEVYLYHTGRRFVAGGDAAHVDSQAMNAY
jgi:ABC-2 type transport system ATP-binding protein